MGASENLQLILSFDQLTARHNRIQAAPRKELIVLTVPRGIHNGQESMTAIAG